MSKKVNYLIGRAEQLTRTVPPPRRNMEKKYIYSVGELRSRLVPQIEKIEKELEDIDKRLYPKNLTVTAITLHPSYISKSAFPAALFRSIGAYPIGSKATEVQPDKWKRKGKPEEVPSTQLFVAFQKENLRDLKNELEQLSDSDESRLRDDLETIWNISLVESNSKIKENENGSHEYFEIGLHLVSTSILSEHIKQAFIKYAAELNIEIRTELAFDIANLWFVPCKGNYENIKKLADFSFVRVIRPVPQLRAFNPVVRGLPVSASFTVPTIKPVNSKVRVAILDGGLPSQHQLAPWVQNYRLSDPKASDCTDGPEHGLGVTSAFLFGPLKPGQQAARPFTYVDHHRVLDSKINGEDPLELYRTLGHIEEILLSNQYEFINLSLGPDLPIDDDEVHPWTSLIDSYLSFGNTLMTVAAGNNGERDHSAGLSRIQVPSDCINAIAVGSSNCTGNTWERASYSAIGPGRSPGRIKPDLVAFGGSPTEYFHVPHSQHSTQLVPTCGTSFASPYVLRMAAGIRAILGEQISLLAIKALLVHTAHRNEQSSNEIGWGKVPDNFAQIIESEEGTVKILYQGELSPGKYLNVPLPIPDNGIDGQVKISATCCISCETDPQDTSMYTRAGITIKWMPQFGSNPNKTESFFKQTRFATEAELRADAGKWESVLHSTKNKRGSSLDEPAFELHYSARENGGLTNNASPVKYAFIVSIEAPKNKTIFSDILTEYQDILTEIEPIVEIPVQIQN